MPARVTVSKKSARYSRSRFWSTRTRERRPVVGLHAREQIAFGAGARKGRARHRPEVVSVRHGRATSKDAVGVTTEDIERKALESSVSHDEHRAVAGWWRGATLWRERVGARRPRSTGATPLPISTPRTPPGRPSAPALRVTLWRRAGGSGSDNRVRLLGVGELVATPRAVVLTRQAQACRTRDNWKNRYRHPRLASVTEANRAVRGVLVVERSWSESRRRRG